jgi:hypothetical protein
LGGELDVGGGDRCCGQAWWRKDRGEIEDQEEDCLSLKGKQSRRRSQVSMVESGREGYLTLPSHTTRHAGPHRADQVTAQTDLMIYDA